MGLVFLNPVDSRVGLGVRSKTWGWRGSRICSLKSCEIGVGFLNFADSEFENGSRSRIQIFKSVESKSSTMKIWEKITEVRLRDRVKISKQQYGFMPGKGTTDAMFALRMLMEKYSKGQRELHCVFVDLEKANDRVLREELWYCMRKSRMAEKYVRLVLYRV